MNTQKTNRGTRVAMELLGVALQSAGTYTGRDINVDALRASKALVANAEELGKLKWSDKRALVTTGKHGSLVRFGWSSIAQDRDENSGGEWMRYKGNDGAFKVVRRDIVAGYNIVALTLTELVETVAKIGDLRLIVQRNDTEDVKAGTEYAGFVYGSVGASYASLLYTAGGKLCVRDIETESNEYNGHVLVSIGDVATIASKADALKARLLATVAAKGEAVKVEGERKARKTRAAKAGK